MYRLVVVWLRYVTRTKWALFEYCNSSVPDLINHYFCFPPAIADWKLVATSFISVISVTVRPTAVLCSKMSYLYCSVVEWVDVSGVGEIRRCVWLLCLFWSLDTSTQSRCLPPTRILVSQFEYLHTYSPTRTRMQIIHAVAIGLKSKINFIKIRNFILFTNYVDFCKVLKFEYKAFQCIFRCFITAPLRLSVRLIDV